MAACAAGGKGLARLGNTCAMSSLTSRTHLGLMTVLWACLLCASLLVQCQGQPGCAECHSVAQCLDTSVCMLGADAAQATRTGDAGRYWQPHCTVWHTMFPVCWEEE